MVILCSVAVGSTHLVLQTMLLLLLLLRAAHHWLALVLVACQVNHLEDRRRQTARRNLASVLPELLRLVKLLLRKCYRKRAVGSQVVALRAGRVQVLLETERHASGGKDHGGLARLGEQLLRLGEELLDGVQEYEPRVPRGELGVHLNVALLVRNDVVPGRHGHTHRVRVARRERLAQREGLAHRALKLLVLHNRERDRLREVLD
mmetsp:Transcript_17695/g.56494  ORF Transcript_17695/g.56494 Transcript_17695/m.56494 type:complete len:205 (-) Transcript_17695:861-1475(-)